MARKPPPGAAGEPRTPGFVSYVRVSTDQQGASGLGLEAQREAIERHIRGAGGRLLAEFQEIESGKRNDRPEIAKAIAECRVRRATLIIAKLDRLARNVAFVSNLMESGVEFVACDNPHATRLTIHILAAVAEHEREMISARTKAALAAARVRGVRLGNPRLQAGDKFTARAAGRVRRRRADEKAASIRPFIDRAEKAGATTLAQKAEALMALGIKTAGGRATWSAEQVRRVIARTGS